MTGLWVESAQPRKFTTTRHGLRCGRAVISKREVLRAGRRVFGRWSAWKRQNDVIALDPADETIARVAGPPFTPLLKSLAKQRASL